ncbi:hypothetical protein KUCAC02_002363 [Chaenocephalus aceratus]|uniref:Uncharacterized protein n=1 Tax=Chaenocephalus aceratus TaxID=36190 RepID=A0ACB9XUJ0_CHAAC|nr:hypothetical protein KUCAC02_002363 [Chaenocephalus aceratus]
MASVSSDEWRAICDKFTNAQNLTVVESLNDPDNDPFRSKYKARELLREIYCSLKSFEAGEGEEERSGETGESGEQLPVEAPVDGQTEEAFSQGFCGDSPAGLRAAKLGAVEYYLGVNHVDTEELSAGQEHLMNSMKLLGRCRVSSENVSLFIHARNQLGILWAGRDETETAQGFLETAESIYQRYMKEDGSPPTDMADYFSTEENQLTHQERTKRFELAYTHTMYYLAQVYKNLGETERAAIYCHSTLQRQLKLNQFSPMEWALNAATLSQYYITKDSIGELDTDRQEEMKRGRRLEEEEEEKERKSAMLFGSEDTFDSIASLEEKVRCLLPMDFTEARAIFLVGQHYVTQAKEYFQMDGYVTDHIEILQDHSSLFRSLAFYEEDLDRRCKMHKRRVDMMEPVCMELNSKYYLMIRRQMMFELAETYNEMMDLKLTLANRQDETESLDSHTIKKFNNLCSASAKYFQMFLDSLCSPEGKQPEHLEEEVLRPALVARFRVARLYSRLICTSPPGQVENLDKSLEHYKYVVDYCDSHPEAVATVETELELSREMVGLLPLKINRIKAKIPANN